MFELFELAFGGVEETYFCDAVTIVAEGIAAAAHSEPLSVDGDDDDLELPFVADDPTLALLLLREEWLVAVMCWCWSWSSRVLPQAVRPTVVIASF